MGIFQELRHILFKLKVIIILFQDYEERLLNKEQDFPINLFSQEKNQSQ
jgi:hypothetical protein